MATEWTRRPAPAMASISRATVAGLRCEVEGSDAGYVRAHVIGSYQGAFVVAAPMPSVRTVAAGEAWTEGMAHKLAAAGWTKEGR